MKSTVVRGQLIKKDVPPDFANTLGEPCSISNRALETRASKSNSLVRDLTETGARASKAGKQRTPALHSTAELHLATDSAQQRPSQLCSIPTPAVRLTQLAAQSFL